MSNVPTNLIPTKITGLPEYTGSSTLGYLPYVLEGRTYKVQFANIAAVGAVPSTREINTGTGLGGGGDLSANRTLYILPQGVDDSRLTLSGVVAGVYGAADSVPVLTINAQGRVTAATSVPIVLTNYVPTSRTITAGNGLSGGGDLSANRTFSVNFSSTTPEPLGPGSPGVSNVAARGDHVHPAVDLSDTTETQGVLPLSRGGTGNSLSPVVGAIAYSSNDRLYLTPTAGTAGQVLTSAGGTGAPYWQTLTGTGTVTDVSVLTANGFAGSVATPTTTATITLQTTVSGVLKGDGTALSAAVAGTDYVAPGAITTSGLTMSTNRLLGRTTASTGAVEQITVGTGLALYSGSIENSAPDQIVSLTGGTGISVSGTYPSFTITNTAPDQIVSLTGAGTTVVTGTYPNFTITSNDQYVGTVTSVSGTGTVNGITLTGTVTSSGSLTLGGTLSNVSLTSQVTGTLPIANGGTGATTAGAARTSLGAAASGANTDITSIALTSGTISNTPVSGTDIANKTYVDSISAGINFHQAVRLASTTGLPAYTYNNGSSGVGATITANANGALTLDSVAAATNDRVLIKNETSTAAAYNGVYVVTQTGSGATPFILTRATDYNTSGTGVNQIDAGDFFLVTAGSTQANTSWVQQTPLPITVGTTAIVFTQFAAPIVYSAGTGLTLAGTVFSITNTGVTANTYGSASSVPVLAINAQGQVTSASNSSIAIAGSQITSGTVAVAQGGTGANTLTGYVKGNGTSAFTASATIPASDISSGAALTKTDDTNVTLTLGGSPTTALLAATSITAGWTGQLAVSRGGTGATTLTNNGVLIGKGTSAITATAAGLTGQVLVGNTGYAPSWATLSSSAVTSFSGGTTGLTPSTATTGAITLAGTLGVANGGTGATTFTTNALLKGDGTSALSSSVMYENGGYVGINVTGPVKLLDGQETYNGEGGFSYVNLSTGASSAASITAEAGGSYFYHKVTRATGIVQFRGVTATTLNQDFTTQVFRSTGGTEYMRLTSTGLGIGTSSPGYKLDISGSTPYTMRVQNTDATSFSNIEFWDNAASRGQIWAGGASYASFGGAGSLNYSANSGPHVWYTNYTERMRLDSSGNVGIGTASPGAKLQVATPASGSGVIFRYTGGTNNPGLYFTTTEATSVCQIDATGSTGTNILAFATSSAERARIDQSGNLGVGTSTPNYRTHIYNANNGYGLQVGSGAGGASAGNYTGILMSPTNGGGNDPYYSGAIRVQTTAASPAYQEPVMTFLVQNPSTYQLADVTEKMRITGGGSLLVGKTSVSGLGEILGVNRTSDGTTAMIGRSGGTNNPYARFIATDSGCVTTIDANGSAGSPVLAFSTNSSERMRIDSSGNVGIGTAASGARIQAIGPAASNVLYRFEPAYTYNSKLLISSVSSGDGGMEYLSTNDLNILTYSNLIFSNGAISGSSGTERMRLDSSGNLGVNTSSPGAKLDVNGVIRSTGTGAILTISKRSTGVGDAWGIYSQSGEFNIYDYTAAANRVTVDTSGNVTVAKKIVPNVQSVASSATITPNADTDTQVSVTALATGATLAAPSGTPSDGQSLVIRIKDNGTGRALTWTTGSSGSYRAVGITLPTTTVANKTMYIGCKYNSTDLRWDAIALSQEA